MTDMDLLRLAERVEGALQLDAEIADAAVKALTDSLPAEWDASMPTRETCENTDEILAIATRLMPGWHYSLSGWATSPNGHWTCSIRRSDVRDNDPFIGIGRGPNLPHALLAALLKAIAFGILGMTPNGPGVAIDRSRCAS